MDLYASFASLAAAEREGRDYRIVACQRDSPFLVAAPHAGGIEPGTGELAVALAGRQHSLYLFEGLMIAGCQSLHITSTCFDEPRALAMAARAAVVITVHGCAGEGQAVYTGGLHLPLQKAVLASLRRAGYQAAWDHDLRAGEHPDNLCNRGQQGQGLQLEITEGLRQTLFASLERPGRRKPTPAFGRFVRTLQSGLWGAGETNCTDKLVQP
jgi:phage replication-related protein YjqB (UPF0714/DUF867 family)